VGAIAHHNFSGRLADLARSTYDIAVVGGGIYGAMLHLEASRAGLRSVLVERGDFGGATSENSLRIVHGGLRYLQNLNVARSIESTRERQWYLSALPRLVTPLPCLLPIYDSGSKRASVLTLGLAANDAISSAVMYLDCSVADVPRGHLLSAHDVLDVAPSIPATGLVGGAVWHDLSLRCPGRVIIEALKWAADFGGTAVNYVEARRLLTSRGGVRGVAVAETGGGATAEVRSRVVVNAAGPWAGELAAKWGAGDQRLSPLVVAWNVLLDRPALSGHAVALQDPSSRSSPLKFATSLGGRLLVGTGYAALRDGCDTAEAVAEEGLDEFLAATNRCVPTLHATRRDVLRLFSGVLPASGPKSAVPRARNLLSDRGPRGLFTISGTKFTTARSAARRALAAVRKSGILPWPSAPPHEYPPCHASAADGLFGSEWTMLDLDERRPGLAQILEEEAVEHLDDLVLRRTTLGDQPVRALTLARSLCSFDERWRQEPEREVARLASALGWRQAARAMNKPGHDGLAAVRTA
jgi:glycerol-3-phosphate dehydrogenase